MSSSSPQPDIVIFCGGRGTRLSEKTREMPKPLIELGEYPILWHIMKLYSHYNLNRFILTLGYKGEMITDYFLYRHPLTQSFSMNLSKPKHPTPDEDWEIAFVQTGIESKTARRLILCRDQIQSDFFMVTYGDGVADIDIPALMKRHKELKKKYGVVATITVTRPYSKYGITTLNGDIVQSFSEKPQMNDYINVGFMVLEKQIFDYIRQDEDLMFEDTLQEVAEDRKLGYYIHEGFWHAMDNYKDYEDLNKMWRENPKWKIWNE
ncbi:glucose-1-phosphate cytidylyltransferase [Methanocalculus taiwanensis]|uniref:Glucose-1-phosphate cytidylyltransferase n=1 Tax=Methanocalculus taiwanensis TaxID=106207 RepID=A0ABD4TJV8_9EURY|nr:sugar phosphate nucleotidyltransferase [Methanocalculus taiwanensis]MCQ1538464.1 glucose-1-phosphate cytidylyltransferase [Methanocalculus taiwanensis]